MSLASFEHFVLENREWFDGHNPEPLAVVEAAETRLRHLLPVSLKWLLTRFGYWRGTGIASLPYLLAATERYRPQFPDHWIVMAQTLNAPVASGARAFSGRIPLSRRLVVLIGGGRDQPDGRAVLICDATGRIVQRYSGYSHYAIACCESARRATNPWYEAAQPEFHRNDLGPLTTGEQAFDLTEFRRRLWETLIFHQLAAGEPDVLDIPEQTEHSFDESATAAAQVSISEADQSCAESTVVDLPQAPQETAVVDAVAHLRRAQSAPAIDREFSTAGPGQRSWTTGIAPVSDQCHQSVSLGGEVRLSEAEIRGLTAQRRQWLAAQGHAIPREWFHATSSPRRSIVLPDRLPAGQLMVTPLHRTEATDLGGWLPSGIGHEWHVALLCPRDAAEQNWLLTWVPEEAIPAVDAAYRHGLQTAPIWILGPEDALQNLPHHLQQLVDATSGND